MNLERLWLHHHIDQLNARYAAALDEKRFDDWPAFFVDDARYTVQARENFDRNLPLALIDLESQGMMKDRVYGITKTIFHAPYYTRHVISPAQVLAPLVPLVPGQEPGQGPADEVIRAQAHYAVFRTKPGGTSEVYNVGRYIDELVWAQGALKFKTRRCVYDSEMVLNSLIYPV